MATSDIGKLIKEAREKRNMSQDDLGELVGLDQRSVSLLEKNNRKLTIQELPLFADALQKPLFYFLGHEMYVEDWNQELLQEFSRIKSPEAKEVIVKITQVFCDYIQKLEGNHTESE